MKLDNIKFAEGEDGAIPTEIQATLTVKEAIFIAKITGKTRGGLEGSYSMYSCLIGDVFNRYWEDGVNDAERELGAVEIPPIDYAPKQNGDGNNDH